MGIKADETTTTGASRIYDWTPSKFIAAFHADLAEQANDNGTKALWSTDLETVEAWPFDDLARQHDWTGAFRDKVQALESAKGQPNAYVLFTDLGGSKAATVATVEGGRPKPVIHRPAKLRPAENE